MPPQLRYSSETVDAQTDAVCSLLDDGYLQIYDGDQPDDGDQPADGTMLVELRFANPAFGPSSGGVAASNTIEMATATETGQARWLRALKSDHFTVVFDGDIGTAGSVLNLDRVNIQANANVIIGTFSYSSPKTNGT